MPSISSCPACHRDLTLPDLADSGTSLRCPLCGAEFSAERALADGVAFPPAAIVVDTLGSTSSGSFDIGGATPAATSDQAMAENAGDTLAAPALNSAVPSPLDWSELPPESAASEPSAVDDSSELFTPQAADGPPATADEASAPLADAAEETASDDYETFGRQVAAMRVAPPVRRQSSAMGALGQVAGIALGGVLGLAIGYYVLIWIGGPRTDVLDLRGKLPRWLAPPVRRHNAAERQTPLSKRKEAPAEARRTLADAVTVPEPPSAVVAARQQAESGFVEPPSDEPIAHADAKQQDSLPPDAVAAALAAGPKPLPPGYRGPKGFKLRNVSELESALEATEQALRCPHCQRPGAVRLASFDTREAAASTPARPCEYCRGKPVLNLPGAFEQLCELAENVTYVRFEADDANRDRLRDAAETILMAIGSHREKSDIVGRVAGARLEDGRRQTNGIVIAGTVKEMHAEGELFAIRLMLLGCGKSVTVISRQAPQPNVAVRDRLLVLGSIIDSPTENLAGYTGDLPQVIWGGLHLKLAVAP